MDSTEAACPALTLLAPVEFFHRVPVRESSKMAKEVTSKLGGLAETDFAAGCLLASENENASVMIASSVRDQCTMVAEQLSG